MNFRPHSILLQLKKSWWTCMLIATFQQRAHCAVGAIGEGIQHHTKKIETSYTRSILESQTIAHQTNESPTKPLDNKFYFWKLITSPPLSLSSLKCQHGLDTMG